MKFHYLPLLAALSVSAYSLRETQAVPDVDATPDPPVPALVSPLPACNCTVTQGTFSSPLPFLSTASNATTFYNYGNPVGSSANTGLEMSETMVIMLHEDLTTGNTSLVVIMDVGNDGTGGNGSVTFNCLPSTAFVQFSDDGGELSGNPPTITGNFNWAACCTDGGIIGGVGCGNTFTINPDLTTGINTFSLVHGTQANPVFIPMPQLNCPITINCGGTACCQEAFEFSATTTDASCEDTPDGAILLTTDCATNPSFLWSTGAVTEDLTGLLPGSYSVTITDANGCSQSETYAIGFQSAAPNPAIIGPDDFCAGEFAELGVSGSFAAYNWSNGMSSPSILVNSPGLYSVTVSNAAGCTATASASLTENPVPVPQITGPSEFCLTDTVTLDAGPGFPFYQWSGGETTQAVEASQVGVYFVTVTNSFGCTGTDLLVLAPLPTPFPVISGPGTVCSGQPVTLDAGPGFDAYAWSNGALTQTVSVSAAGTYAVTVSFDNGCTGTASLPVSANPADTSLFFLSSCNPADTGTFVQAFSNQFGCDSIEILTVSYSSSDSVLLFFQSCLPADTGTVTQTFLNQFGCDSIVVATTALLPSDSVFLFFSSCNPLDTGTVVQTFANLSGCDSTVVTYTAFLASDTTYLSAGSCSPADTGIFVVALVGEDGCDSLVITTVSLLSSDTTLLEAFTCDPDLSGLSAVLLQNQSGCDSLVITSTVLIPADTTFLSDFSCFPADTGTVVTVLSNAAGCDSVLVSAVALLPSQLVLLSQTSCDPAQAGVDTLIFTNQSGCDSIIITTTSFATSDTTLLFEDTCDPAAAGVFAVPLLSTDGCDSIVITTVSLLPADTTFVSAAACDPAQTGTTTAVLSNQFGCDSTVVTTTTLLPSDTTFLSAASCDPAQTGTTTAVLSNQFGCDSTVVTTTALLPSDTTWLTQSTCLAADTGTVQTLLSNQFGCDSLVLTLTSLLPPAACTLELTGTPDTIGCQTSTGTIFLTVLNGTGPYAFTWTAAGGNTGSGTIPQAFVPTPVPNLPPGDYSFEVSDPDGLTSTVTASVFQPAPLQVLPAVTSDFNGADLSCDDAADGAATVTVTGGGLPPYTYLWSNGGTDAATSGLPAGTASVTVTGSAGCTAVGSVGLSAPLPLSATVATTQPDCFGDGTGSLQLVQVAGGTGTYRFALDGGDWQPDPLFDRLSPGGYLLQVQDANGCETAVAATLSPYTSPTVSLGVDQELAYGDSLTLQPLIQLPAGALGTVFWSGADCPDCLSLTVRPLTTTTYGITVTDTAGCEASDEIVLFVRKDFRFFFPNAFSPDGNGINDHFTVFAGPQVLRIREMAVFDRWGGTVFRGRDLLPNDVGAGWDGTSRGQDLPAGVFTFFAVLEFVDGNTELVKGELSLVR